MHTHLAAFSNPHEPTKNPPASAAPAVCATMYRTARGTGHSPHSIVVHVIRGLMCTPVAGAVARISGLSITAV